MYSILKTCEQNKDNPDFDIVKFMREKSNKSDKATTLKYTHLGPLSLDKKDGMASTDFKQKLVRDIFEIVQKGFVINDVRCK